MVNTSFAQKATRIKLVATDIDGVWTDACMYYTSKGEAMKMFSTYDGMAVQLLREANIPVVIMTGEDSEIVTRRAEKLKIDRVYLAEKHKLKRLTDICAEMDLQLSEVAFIGDDLNDIEVLQNVGFSAMPPNSPMLDNFTPDFISERCGGKGAFRDFADEILKYH